MADNEDTQISETRDEKGSYRRAFSLERISQAELEAELERRRSIDRWAVKQELQNYVSKKWPGLKLGEILTARDPEQGPARRRGRARANSNGN